MLGEIKYKKDIEVDENRHVYLQVDKYPDSCWNTYIDALDDGAEFWVINLWKYSFSARFEKDHHHDVK